MKLRKVLATTLAIAMAVLAIPAVPAQAFTMESLVPYVDTEVYDFEVPTTASAKFYLDPQGVSDIAFGNATPTNKGKIISATTMSAINNSSRPLNIEVSAAVVATPSSLSVVVSEGAFDTYNTNAVVESAPAIYLTLSTTKMVGDGVKAVTKGGIETGSALDTTAEVFAANVSGSAVSKTYGMSPADYKIVTKSAITVTPGAVVDEAFASKNYEYKKTSTGSAIDIKIGGKCTTNTDWSDFADNANAIKLDLTFTVTKADGDEATSTGAGSGSGDTYVMQKSGSDVTYTFVNKPTGSLTAIVIDGTARAGALGANHITYSEGVLKFNATAVNSFLSTTGNHTIIATIGGTAYTLTYTK